MVGLSAAGDADHERRHGREREVSGGGGQSEQQGEGCSREGHQGERVPGEGLPAYS